jgi:hypothetical protein
MTYNNYAVGIGSMPWGLEAKSITSSSLAVFTHFAESWDRGPRGFISSRQLG